MEAWNAVSLLSSFILTYLPLSEAERTSPHPRVHLMAATHLQHGLGMDTPYHRDLAVPVICSPYVFLQLTLFRLKALPVHAHHLCLQSLMRFL